MIKGYNWLKSFQDVIPENIEEMSNEGVALYLKKHPDLYVTGDSNPLSRRRYRSPTILM